MHARLMKARDAESGFTLVELLVVIGIIAILTAIAVPMFLSQRQKANDASVRSDVKSAVTTIETGAIDNPGGITLNPTGINTVSIRTGTVTTTPTSPGIEAGTVALSDGVTLSAVGNTIDGYIVTGFHENGNKFVDGSPLVYKNTDGGFKK